MRKEFKNRSIGAHFLVADHFCNNFVDDGEYLLFLWNHTEQPVQLQIDLEETVLNPNQLVCATYLHQVQIDKKECPLRTLIFNREFYCIHTNDSEVSCNGLLFFGSKNVPILELDEELRDRLNTAYHYLTEEFDVNDNSQEEMLRILLKRFIILCTRIAKEQLLGHHNRQGDIDLIRSFNLLVEEHFREVKSVSEYAKMLNKSPKTVANIFSKNADQSPLEVIHQRVITEAKRLLLYTDKAVKEIGLELGYTDPAQFSKLFKKETGMTTTTFKETHLS
ncbi:MAG: helix-turn-helix domain-containing protein [Balneolaceae bacterium]